MKQKLSITVRGKHKTWNFKFDGDPKYLDEWRADGLEVDALVYSIPEWVPGRFLNVWCFLQDCFYLRNPFAKS